MDFVFTLISVYFLVMFAEAQAAEEGPCFHFNGDSYLHFTPNNFNNNNSIHYSLKFRTTQENGIIMYSRGLQGDDEALFLKDGKLRYHLFNTSPTGIDGSFGAYLEGEESVNTDQWIKVQVYRSWAPYNRKQRRPKKKTGFEVEINGTLYSHLDYFERNDISILPIIYFGGYKESLSSQLHNFMGQIMDISEEKNGYKFENPSLNYGSKVQLSCLEPVQPN